MDKKMKKALFIIIVTFMLSLTFFGCSNDTLNNPVSSDNLESLQKNPNNLPTFVEIAASNTNLSYLVAAVQFTNLADALNGNRQFTVFAPVNQAFLDLATSLNLTIEELFTEPYRDLVTSVLLYHVSPGQKKSQNFISSARVNTLLEQFAFTRIENGSAQIGNDTNGYANIVAVDIRASNGMVHVLDKVIVPVLP
jgi:uncharacterized surface protein with fasciclin (FAS1) repeats